MSHYETLGVGKEADDAAIKRRYRYLASQLHPDREGGDAERMAAVNRAYAVLSDPARRARYDETGSDGDRSLEELAFVLLSSMIEKAVAEGEGDWIGRTGVHLDAFRGDLVMKKAGQEDTKRRLLAQLGKFKRKDAGPNLFDVTIQRHADSCTQHIGQLTEAMQVHAAAVKMLKEYEGPPPPPVDPYEASADEVNTLARMVQASIFQQFRNRP